MGGCPMPRGRLRPNVEVIDKHRPGPPAAEPRGSAMTTTHTTRRLTALALTVGPTLASLALSGAPAQAKKITPTVDDGAASVRTVAAIGDRNLSRYPLPDLRPLGVQQATPVSQARHLGAVRRTEL